MPGNNNSVTNISNVENAGKNIALNYRMDQIMKMIQSQFLCLLNTNKCIAY